MEKKNSFGRIIKRMEDRFDIVKFSIKKWRNNFDPAIVITYLGYGRKEVFYLKGRVLENKGITGATKEDSLWRNLGNMYKRFESDEIPEVTLKVNQGKKSWEVITDEEGYFEINLQPDEIILSEQWQGGDVEIIKCTVPHTPGIKYKFQTLVPSSSAAFGIISDIDDTIVETHATSLLKMFRSTFFNNAKTRSPFRGASSFYKELEKAQSKSNPFFYVSSSPWNLYDMLLEFLISHEFPLGPLLLKDYGINKKSVLSEGHLAHKYFQIEKIMATYPELSFILIGDSGQDDPMIYQQVIKDFPGRVLVAYIRDVNIPKHTKKVMDIRTGMAGIKTEIVLVKDSLEAAVDATGRGYITKDSVDRIEKDMLLKSKQ